ncbi:hypothetical protein P154DRAFT_571359 [Amniculicola lignicola CBS 123094]|uniref:Uncharacterized protein n=1 Tax=Amniculicola lignicola CBS 123094 TaxID=1392246 RepID=A0A6A5X114_9PLEO|nr:hypothetical protein P154DRAFT_571359 [Amniculicola lignicola CBS 123094]
MPWESSHQASFPFKISRLQQTGEGDGAGAIDSEDESSVTRHRDCLPTVASSRSCWGQYPCLSHCLGLDNEDVDCFSAKRIIEKRTGAHVFNKQQTPVTIGLHDPAQMSSGSLTWTHSAVGNKAPLIVAEVDNCRQDDSRPDERRETRDDAYMVSFKFGQPIARSAFRAH